MMMTEVCTNAMIPTRTRMAACTTVTKKTEACRNATIPMRTREEYRIVKNRKKKTKEVCTNVTTRTEVYTNAKSRTMMKKEACTTVTTPMRTNAMRMKAGYRTATRKNLIPLTNAIRLSSSSLRPMTIRPRTIPQTMTRLRTIRASCRLGLAIRAPARSGP